MPVERRRRFRAAASLACCSLLAAGGLGAGSAEARWVVKGAGFGHGVGMSQYGAFGFAKRGYGYRAILGHYYRGTSVGTIGGRKVKVLLRSGARSARFSGASMACGRSVNPRKAYAATPRGSKVDLRTGKGRRLRGCGRALKAGGPGGVKLLGKGRYRGKLIVRAGGRGVSVVNAVPIESYVAGVVALESPSSWPLDALRAQAVAARSYAVATARRGKFHHYDDTRSQVYGGVRAETARTDKAIAQTRLEVVLYKGGVAETYFFSTSGGHTENNEKSFLGGTPLPYLRGVPDPYDGASRYHRWKRKLSERAMRSRLGGLVRGKLRRVKVLKRGASPRIVKAKLIGSGGATRVTGPTLRARLGLPDTWARFVRK